MGGVVDLEDAIGEGEAFGGRIRSICSVGVNVNERPRKWSSRSFFTLEDWTRRTPNKSLEHKTRCEKQPRLFPTVRAGIRSMCLLRLWTIPLIADILCSLSRRGTGSVGFIRKTRILRLGSHGLRSKTQNKT